MDKDVTIISLGGSLIVPDDIDIDFVGDFLEFVRTEVGRSKRFVIITGGGKICRRYQAAAASLGASSQAENDWVGIHVTRLNGNFLRILLGDLAYEEVIVDPADLMKAKAPVVVAAGWKPGWSTDFDAVEMAKASGAKRVINLSNVDYVFDKDPKQFPDAKRLEKVSWQEFRKIIPAEWKPGLNSPFDPVAAKNAESLKIEVAFMNGRDIDNLNNYISGRPFRGTVIS